MRSFCASHRRGFQPARKESVETSTAKRPRPHISPPRGGGFQSARKKTGETSAAKRRVCGRAKRRFFFVAESSSAGPIPPFTGPYGAYKGSPIPEKSTQSNTLIVRCNSCNPGYSTELSLATSISIASSI